MPWQLLELPSLAIGLLHQRVREARPADTVVEYHGCLDWAEHLLAVTDGALSPDDYTDIADNGLHHGLGDWIFAGSLYGDPTWRTAELHRYAESARVDIDRAVRMRPHVDGFIALAAKKILATDPQVVGFTTTFMQNVPSLALAKRLKHLRPDLLVVMGGANCDGPMGHALHRNHPFVDYAVRGEGEIVLPRLLDRIEAGTGVHDLPGVCWWHDGESVANEQAHTTVPPAMIPVPDFDSWQAQLSASPVREYVEPKLVLEGARGCWWGEKHQCTFCGLNGSFITFRSKSPEQLWHEIQTLMRRHRLLDLIMVDNILDMRYFHGLLPRLAASEWDLRIHYEVKSNLREDQVRQLAEARVAHVQPGIESLSSHALNLMDKGVSGTANVRLLRDCEDHQLTVSWNYLYGFPGECDDNYLAIIAQIPALVHLQPPGSATRIALERFSPYFEQPALGFPERTPAKLYDHVYDLPLPSSWTWRTCSTRHHAASVKKLNGGCARRLRPGAWHTQVRRWSLVKGTTKPSSLRTVAGDGRVRHTCYETGNGRRTNCYAADVAPTRWAENWPKTAGRSARRNATPGSPTAAPRDSSFSTPARSSRWQRGTPRQGRFHRQWRRRDEPGQGRRPNRTRRRTAINGVVRGVPARQRHQPDQC
ncbi:hypothetical protein Prum_072830 [Phytohabitans rumicis]|uniref:B12-binding domain-containing protein n=2 Tax=Phytohabitans rumicis TaxID=1076125 RepID=A0A6V8LFN0_9ACTN|nr:hypothetical protein Prum_072830 [Phytohabitans rumicis]